MKLKTIGCEAAGFFRLVVSGGERGTVDLGKELGHVDGLIPNLILDNGIKLFLSNITYYDTAKLTYGYIQLGTGNSTPNPQQLGLDNYGVGGGSTLSSGGVSYGYNSVDGYGWTRKSHQFGAGVAAGTWAEIASAPAATGNCFSRALIVDVNGAPTTITILENEFLTVTYVLRSWWVVPAPHEISYDDEDIDGNPTISTTTVTYGTPLEEDLAGAPVSAGMRANTGSLSYGGISGTIRTMSLLYDISAGNPSIERADFRAGDFRYFNKSRYPFSFSPPIAKTNEFSVKIDFQIEFKRRGE